MESPRPTGPSGPTPPWPNRPPLSTHRRKTLTPEPPHYSRTIPTPFPHVPHPPPSIQIGSGASPLRPSTAPRRSPNSSPLRHDDHVPPPDAAHSRLPTDLAGVAPSPACLLLPAGLIPLRPGRLRRPPRPGLSTLRRPPLSNDVSKPPLSSLPHSMRRHRRHSHVRPRPARGPRAGHAQCAHLALQPLAPDLAPASRSPVLARL